MSIADWNPADCGPLPGPMQRIAGDSGERESAESIEAEHGELADVEAERPETELKKREPPAAPRGDQKCLHRLAEVRKQQGISPRNMARRLNVDITTIMQQEEESADLPLSVLYAWQEVLDVPVCELLVDDNAPLSAPVYERAQMVKLMKTAAAILEKAQTNSLRRMVTMLIEQLLEIMPELRDVSPWHTVGQRRTLDDFGRAAERQLPDDFLRRLSR